MKAFVTGATGFVGTHLIDHLHVSGDEVLATSQSSPPANLAAIPRNKYEMLQWDITKPASPDLIKRLQEFQPDCVYHLAALSVPKDNGGTEPTRRALDINVGGVRHLVDLVRSLSYRPRILLISSGLVYSLCERTHPFVDEKTVTNPQSAYAKTKLAAERVLSELMPKTAIEYVIVRPFQHTGIRQIPRMMLPEWAKQFAERVDPIRVLTLNSIFDLTDVHDVVRAYRLLVQSGRQGEIYNVGSGVGTRSGDVFEMLRKISGYPCGVIETDPGHRQHPLAKIDKIARDTGWHPMIPLEQTVKETFHYWQTLKDK